MELRLFQNKIQQKVEFGLGFVEDQKSFLSPLVSTLSLQKRNEGGVSEWARTSFFALGSQGTMIDLDRARSPPSSHRSAKIKDLRREVIPECSGIPV